MKFKVLLTLAIVILNLLANLNFTRIRSTNLANKRDDESSSSSEQASSSASSSSASSSSSSSSSESSSSSSSEQRAEEKRQEERRQEASSSSSSSQSSESSSSNSSSSSQQSSAESKASQSSSSSSQASRSASSKRSSSNKSSSSSSNSSKSSRSSSSKKSSSSSSSNSLMKSKQSKKEFGKEYIGKKKERVVFDDEEYNRIRDHIKKLAVISMSKSNLAIKKKLVGSLSDSYPETRRLMARKKHYELKKFRPIMALPNKIYKFCIYPSYDLNYSKWCEEKYATKSESKLMNCRHTFCQVCCDNLQIMLKNQADNNVIGELLRLSKASGYKLIQQATPLQDIHDCKRECTNNYPVQYPPIPLPVPRDDKLGKWAETPAKSCADIKKWGALKNDSGTYWIDLGERGKTRVYCDMYAMNGGWTLFFNYMKMPNADVAIREGKMPTDLKKNTHMNLRNGGFSENDVQELRFLCTEKLSNRKTFWHFKTDSPKVLSTAFNGKQNSMDLAEFKDTYSELQFPGKAIMYKKAMDQFEMQDSLDFVGRNPTGGFWDRPFGSHSKGNYWTVKGSNSNRIRFECGTKHKSQLESSNAYTHHTVWFRGDPPSEDFARARYYNKEINKLEGKIVKAQNDRRQAGRRTSSGSQDLTPIYE